MSRVSSTQIAKYRAKRTIKDTYSEDYHTEPATKDGTKFPDKIVCKKCSKCGESLYIHVKDNVVTFVKCRPNIIGIKLGNRSNTMNITGHRSTKTVVCKGFCYTKHLIKTFKEVKDVV